MMFKTLNTEIVTETETDDTRLTYRVEISNRSANWSGFQTNKPNFFSSSSFICSK